MKHGSLFSGIGGFDLAAEWMGWENIFHCEWNPFGQKVLNYYWPDAESFTDITKSDFTKYNGTIDIISGGFPCQPYSQAGKRKGKEDERHLWPEMLRAIREVQPRWIVGENVSGLLNWNGGLVLDEIKADLEGEGFEVFPPCVLPACGVNAPHRRDRVWIVAYSHSVNGRQGTGRENWQETDNIFTADAYSSFESKIRGNNEENSTNKIGEMRSNNDASLFRRNSINAFGAITNANSKQRPKGGMHSSKFKEAERHTGPCDARSYERTTWQEFPTQSPLCNGNDGLSTQLDGITFSKWRTESIKAGGNAVVPQIPFEIFKAIEQYEQSR